MASESLTYDAALSRKEQEIVWLWPLLNPCAQKHVRAAVAGMDEEVKVRRVLAFLEKKFGPVEGARPTLTLIQGGKVVTP